MRIQLISSRFGRRLRGAVASARIFGLFTFIRTLVKKMGVTYPDAHMTADPDMPVQHIPINTILTRCGTFMQGFALTKLPFGVLKIYHVYPLMVIGFPGISDTLEKPRRIQPFSKFRFI